MPTAAPEVELNDRRIRELESLIRESFRVRDNQTPVYVDVAENLRRVSLKQHQVVFGRRGSGKSCLLVYYRHEVAPREKVHTAYVLGDTIKTLDYPDVLLRLLLEVFEKLPNQRLSVRLMRMLKRAPRDADAIKQELRELLALPSQSSVVVTTGVEDAGKDAAGFKASPKPLTAELSSERSSRRTREEIRESDERKVRTIENRLLDYKAAIQSHVEGSKCQFGVFIIDDFYLIQRDVQPDVIDYLHQLLRDTDLYFKVGTVRHRSSMLRTSPVHVGIQTHQDVDGFNLDQTLEDLGQTGAYLETMLRELGRRVDLDDVLTIMSDDARKDLVLLSGGVPRDYLNIFVGGIERARATPNRRRVTPTDLRRAAVALSNETKLRDLRTDAGSEVPALEALFVDVVRFCLTEKRKTAFLVSHEHKAEHPDVHDLIQQLMDFKLIHLVEPSTSAASGRPGRYEAYTLDFSLFMEPRRRNIEVVRFWETDDQRRRVKLREAPVYDLARAKGVATAGAGVRAEEAIEIANRVESEPEGEPLQLFADERVDRTTG
jgi:hypothetical protein